METLSIKKMFHAVLMPTVILVSNPSMAAPQPKPLNEIDINAMFSSLDRSPSLAGPDTNRNGIRDDIEQVIVTMFPDALQRRATLQAAKSLQAAILVDTKDNDATGAVSLASSRAISCLFERFPTDQNGYVHGIVTAGWISRKLEAMTVNTRPRVQAYLKYNEALNGTTSSSPVHSACD